MPLLFVAGEVHLVLSFRLRAVQIPIGNCVEFSDEKLDYTNFELLAELNIPRKPNWNNHVPLEGRQFLHNQLIDKKKLEADGIGLFNTERFVR